MAKIQDKNLRYSLLKHYVYFMFKWAYRKVEYYGKENIPQDGAIIYAPNHTNTLMDALAILAIDSRPKIFVARADVFKHPTALKFLTFLKMLPINRKRDGVGNLAKNEDVNNIVVDALQDKVPFCILPEGTHRAMHSLMPLQKGLFRIALQANDTFGSRMPVYIVPVGIEFGHFFRYRSSLLVQIGKPIHVTQFIAQHPDLAVPEQINALRNELAGRLKELILHIPDDAHYNAAFALAQVCGHKNSLIDRFKAAKEAINRLADVTETQPLFDTAEDLSRQRHRLGIGMESVLHPHIGWSVAGKILLLLAGFPLFIASSVATSPISLLAAWLCAKFEDPAFHNTLRCMIASALAPVLSLLTGLIFGMVFSWVWGVTAALLLFPSFLFLHEYLRWFRLLISHIKWLLHRDLYRQFNQIKNFKR